MSAALAMAPTYDDTRECCAGCGGPLRREEVIGTRQREAIEARAYQRAQAEVRALLVDIDREHIAAGRDIEAMVALTVWLCGRPVEARVYDVHAERRVLGWLLSGKARARDFEGLGGRDWSCSAHAWIWAFGLALLEAAAAKEPSMVPSRDLLDRAARLEGVALNGALGMLPRPAFVPRREVDLVAALGRRWR